MFSESYKEQFMPFIFSYLDRIASAITVHSLHIKGAQSKFYSDQNYFTMLLNIELATVSINLLKEDE